MKIQRLHLSLSGFSSTLMAIGGENNAGNLKDCERYLIISNKWRRLPELNRGRTLPGSVLLKSMKAFCFCGTNLGWEINSIEGIQIGTEEEWRVLPLNDDVALRSNLAGVSF